MFFVDLMQFGQHYLKDSQIFGEFYFFIKCFHLNSFNAFINKCWYVCKILTYTIYMYIYIKVEFYSPCREPKLNHFKHCDFNNSPCCIILYTRQALFFLMVKLNGILLSTVQVNQRHLIRKFLKRMHSRLFADAKKSL